MEEMPYKKAKDILDRYAMVSEVHCHSSERSVSILYGAYGESTAVSWCCLLFTFASQSVFQN